MAKKLTKKQQLFVDEYLIDLNATQAAIRAGYSVDTAREIGCENLTKPNIQQAIAKVMAERSKRTGINQDRVVLELAKIAFVKMTDIVDDEGNIIYADDFKYTDLKYENLDLVKTKYKEFEIELPKEMEYVEIGEKEREEENLTEYFHVWRGGYDFDIIKMDILEGYDNIYDAAQMFYKNAKNTFIPGTDNECAYNNIKIEETTVISNSKPFFFKE